jgi:hypothetical protein
MSDERNPAAVVRAAADLRMFTVEVDGLWKRIKHAEKSTLIEFKELGDRLRRCYSVLPRGEKTEWLKARGIPQPRASEAIKVSSNWKKVSERDSLHAFLKACSESLLVQSDDDPETDISSGADASELGPDELPAIARIFLPTPEPAPPEVPGDANEEAGVVDAEGALVPATAILAFEDKSIDEFAAKISVLADEVKDLAKKPSGAFLNTRQYATKLRAIREMFLTRKPSHVCNRCGGGGCKTCKKLGCIPKYLWAEK